MRSLSIAALIASGTSTEALSTITPTGLYSQLQATPLFRASDEQPIVLPDLWRADTPLGIADEVSVTAFLRHFG